MSVVSLRKRVKKRFEKKIYLGLGDYLAWAGGILYNVVVAGGRKHWVSISNAPKLPKVGHMAGGIEIAQPKRGEYISRGIKRWRNKKHTP